MIDGTGSNVENGELGVKPKKYLLQQNDGVVEFGPWIWVVEVAIELGFEYTIR